ncbi:unnamed protein product [Linum trigynum]|uniref:CCHC-type domain-containing protein n=1 Tax=Linum trigynum TaxID=586398 RepID=A0AAV2FV69_9ROSI
MIVWVQLPALKIHFYHKEVVTTLGNLIGRTIKLDYHTLTQQRAKFARLTVEVDLSKHLVPRIWLDDAWQKVEYENLPEVCFECGKIGHCSAVCPLLKPAVLVNFAVAAGGDSSADLPVSEEDANPGFGPWMLVSRKSRRNARDGQRKGKGEQDSGSQNQMLGHKQGKKGTGGKEGNQAFPIQDINNGHLSQVSQTHERKVVITKKNGAEGRRGVEANGRDAGSKGKGLLGPSPVFSESNPNRTEPNCLADEASTSAQQTQAQASLQQRKYPDRPQSEIRTPARQEPTGQQPPLLSTKTITGPNGTVMQIIENPESVKENAEPNISAVPSLAARTKSNKKKISQSNKSSTKLNIAKPLQIWSSIKDRKPKSKARVATLTLQEISAWTKAAKKTAGESGGKVAAVTQAACEPLAKVQTTESSPPA